MDALVMCGGRGTRLDAPVEKPLFEVAGRPMIEQVSTALADSSVDTVYAAPSPQTPETRAFLESRSVRYIETPGDGYVADLNAARSQVSDPVLTAAADLPLLASDLVDQVLSNHDGGSLSLAVPRALKEVLGVSYDRSFDHEGQTVVPAGINIVADDGEEATHVSYDARLAVNVNRREDAAVAGTLLPTSEENEGNSEDGDRP
jgi:adenosylcobinamide-phosphate guanylyltransferase